MGKRGPLPKKKHLKDLSRAPLTKERMQEVARIYLHTDPPDPPAHLTKEELKVWNETIDLLKPAGILQRIDAAVLAAYCCSYARWNLAESEIKEEAKKGYTLSGLVSEGANNQLVVHPLINISRRERADMILFANQLGMTPSARMRIDTQPPKETENPFAALKKKKQNGEMDAKSNQLRGVRKPHKK
jgi:P27 family predicted phage terminase small subunit